MSNLNFILLLLLAVAVVVAHEWSIAFGKPQEVAVHLQVVEISPEQRHLFVDEMAAAIDLVNGWVQEHRLLALDLRDRLLRAESLEAADLLWLQRLAQDLGLPPWVDSSDWWQLLLARLDVVPRDLLLAQAILHSNWGSSDAAKRSNRYFPPACTLNECREDELKEPFISKEAAVAAQVQLINSHANYQLLRQLRVQLRRAGGEPLASELLPGLLPLAWRGNAELIELRQQLVELASMRLAPEASLPPVNLPLTAQ